MDKRLHQLILKRLTGNLTDIDRQALKELMTEEEHRWMDQTESDDQGYDVESARRRIRLVVSKDIAHARQTRLRWRLAASFVAIFLVSTALVVWRVQLPQAAVAMKELATKPGHHKVVTLPDGSIVTLNGGSSLRFPEKFGEASREVFVEGEALFDVRKESRPFFVNVGEYRVDVLGTVFNVAAYGDSPLIEVALVEGLVKFRHRDLSRTFFLKPSQKVVVDRHAGQVTVAPFDVQVTTGWTNRLLVFSDDPLPEVLHKLERTYAIIFRFEPADFQMCRVTGEFQNESVWTVLEAIRYATGIRYEALSEDQIDLTGKCRSSE